MEIVICKWDVGFIVANCFLISDNKTNDLHPQMTILSAVIP